MHKVVVVPQKEKKQTNKKAPEINSTKLDFM